MGYKTLGISGDFPDLNSGINYLINEGVMNESYVLRAVSDIANSTEVIPGGVKTNGQTVEIDLNGFSVESSTRIAIDRFNGVDVNAGCGTLKLHNGVVKATANLNAATLLYIKSMLCPLYQSYLICDNLVIDTSAYSGSQSILTTFGLEGNVQGYYQNDKLEMRFLNIRIAAKRGVSNGIGIHYNWSGMPNFSDNTRLRLMENCSVRCLDANVHGISVSFNHNAYATFKNVAVYGASDVGKDWALANYPDLYTIKNCADSDDSLTLGLDNMPGVTGGDFVSIDPLSDDYLKIPIGSKLRDSGTIDLAGWNASDFGGRPRPNHRGLCCIGAHEPISADATLIAKINGEYYQKTKRIDL